MTELIKKITDLIKGIYRCECGFCDKRIIYFERLNSRGFEVYDLKAGAHNVLSFGDVYDGNFQDISPRNLTPDEAENLAYYEIELSATQEKRATRAFANHLVKAYNARDKLVAKLEVSAQSQPSRTKVGDKPDYRINLLEHVKLTPNCSAFSSGKRDERKDPNPPRVDE